VDAPLTSRNHSPAINEQGGVTIRVRAIDNLGNISGWSLPVHYYYDATAPTISSPADITVNNDLGENGAIVNYNVSALDNLDVTVSATCVPASGTFFPVVDTTVTCNASDTAGNNATPTTFVVTVTDNEAPYIKTNGSSGDLVLTVGNTYSELGATAIDNYDDIFDATPTGFVNTAIAGVYTITYNATDSSGNVADPVARTVTVNAAPIVPATTQTTQATTTRAFTGVLGATTDGTDTQPTDTTYPGDTEVLGAENSNQQDTSSAVLGTVKKVGAQKVWLGVAWYWWLLALVALLVLYFVLRRNRNELDQDMQL
jgi:hypothetical protein